MLFSASPRRLVLLGTIGFILVILSVQRTSYGAFLPSTRIAGLSSSHNGKGRPEGKANGRFEVVGDGGLQVPAGKHDKILGQSHVQPSRPGHEGKHGDPNGPADANGIPMRSSSAFQSAVQVLTKPNASPLPHEPFDKIQSKVHQLRAKWAPPTVGGHWPPYNWFGGVDYDPNLWEGFEWNNDFYTRSGVKKLAKENPKAAKPVPYLPYPDYNRPQWTSQWRGEYVSCIGARGKLLNESKEDWVLAYPGLPDGFPEPAVGDAGVTGLDVGHCIDRYHRFGPYGHGQNGKKRVYSWDRPRIKPMWPSVRWGQLQEQCLLSNKDRYRPNAQQPLTLTPGSDLPIDTGFINDDESHSRIPKYHPRTALLIRAWQTYDYTDNDLEAIRALITELSLLSGGEYQVFLLVNIKNRKIDLTNKPVQQGLLDKYVPRELHSISLLWNEKILEEWYPKVGDWQVYWHQFMPLQWFSNMYPQFDFVWNWETDARYTGNHYHFLEQVAAFAKAVPRKYMWERNQRFYFPDAHGSYKQWLADTDATIEAGVKNGSLEVVWGPQPYNKTYQTPIGPTPPRSLESDEFDWGVGEDADLITLQPIWDPTHTQWAFRDKIFNFFPGIRPQFSAKDPLDDQFTHPDFVNIPRRTYINTVSRFSRRLLHAMHVENRAGRTMQAEMWPATVALHHGLKAVYAPHPIWTDRKWPGWYMDAVFNADGQEFARWGARNDSVYNQDREHNFAGWSWYYSTEFPKTLYRRWLGWTASVGSERQFPNNPLRVMGGKEFEERGVKYLFPEREPDGSAPTSATGSFIGGRKKVVGGQGRMCLPPMLLHPVKRVSEEEQVEIWSNSGSRIGLSRAWEWIMDRFY